MKTFTFLFVLMLGFTANTQAQTKFEQAMGQTLQAYGEAQDNEALQAVANRFERIAQAEKEEWLPRYYHAWITIRLSFNQAGEARDKVLDDAADDFEKMLALAPQESEVYALQGMYYTARLTVDPATRGMEYSMLAGQAVGKARGLDEKNPRAIYVQLSQAHGKAGFFGEDPAKYCAEARVEAERFDDYKTPSPLYPRWGKEQLIQLGASCGE